MIVRRSYGPHRDRSQGQSGASYGWEDPCERIRGTYQSPRAHNNARQIDEALTELKEEQILLSIQKDIVRGQRNSLVDITYTLLPTIEFIDEVKKANRRTTLLAQKLLSAHHNEVRP
jgi:hypothetical protein